MLDTALRVNYCETRCEDEEGGECENGEGSCDQGVWQGAPEEGDPVLSPDLGDDDEDD
jgi:hypothetical protein